MINWKAAIAAVLFLCHTAASQQGKKAVVHPPEEKTSAQADEKANKKAKDLLRSKLVESLESIAGQVVALDPPQDRARVYIQVADAYWPIDKDRPRTLFTKGFDETEKISEDSGIGRQRTANRVDALRQELLARVARRDPELAASLLSKVVGSDDSTRQKPSEIYGTGMLSEALVRVAQRLLDTDVRQSVALATLSLKDGMSQSLRRYLMDLRAKDSGAANSLVASALKQAASRHPARLFEMLLLWEFAFQPDKLYFGIGLSTPR